MIRYLFHPLLFFLLLIYISVEILFLVTFTNTLGSHTGLHNFSYFETFGRNISAFGIGLSFLLFLSTRAISVYSLKTRFWFKTISFLLVFWLSSMLLKTVFEQIVDNASSSLIRCSVIGSIAQNTIDQGDYSYFKAWSDESYFTTIEEFHLGKILAPFAVCMSPDLEGEITAAPDFADNILALYGELKVFTDAGWVAREPYIQIEKNLDKAQKALFFYTNSRDKGKAIEKIKKDASSNARKFGIDNIENRKAFSEIFACTIKRAYGASNYWKAKEALLPSALQCNSEYVARGSDRVSASSANVPIDLYELGRTVAAHHMAHYLTLNDDSMDVEKLDDMKAAVASAVLPVFIYFVSTFVIALCLASYIKSRINVYFLRAHRVRSPVANFVFSFPFIVVTISVLLWNAPQSRFEKNIFPTEQKSFFSEAVMVGLRGAFISYPEVRKGLKKWLNVTPHFYFRSYSMKARYSLIHLFKVGKRTSFQNDELVEKFNKAMQSRLYTTPISQSALRFGDMLIQRGYPPNQLSDSFENIYRFYRKKNLERALYINEWRNTWIE